MLAPKYPYPVDFDTVVSIESSIASAGEKKRKTGLDVIARDGTHPSFTIPRRAVLDRSATGRENQRTIERQCSQYWKQNMVNKCVAICEIESYGQAVE